MRTKCLRDGDCTEVDAAFLTATVLKNVLHVFYSIPKYYINAPFHRRLIVTNTNALYTNLIAFDMWSLDTIYYMEEFTPQNLIEKCLSNNVVFFLSIIQPDRTSKSLLARLLHLWGAMKLCHLSYLCVWKFLEENNPPDVRMKLVLLLTRKKNIFAEPFFLCLSNITHNKQIGTDKDEFS
ncbi:hypothetical protein ACJX0J_023122 [Zea mays]